jgi:hypothetical protein
LRNFCFLSEQIQRRALAGGLRTAAELTPERRAGQVERCLFAELAVQG